nr:hypothetical protein [uncultured Lachnoclostridium sp.]
MSEEEILQNDLRYIFELVRVHKDFNKVPDKNDKKSNVPDYTQEEKFIDEISL